MMARIWSGSVLFLLGVAYAAAAPASSSAPASKEMNGYKLEDFSGFEKNWHFVTVRYRRDSREMRFVYANDSAWKALNQGVTEYPDGAIFAKIGVATADDPSFPSSVTPSGTRRFQLMIRNAKKHENTDGWGYALFDEHGLTLPEDVRLQEQACAACHRIVRQRGFVFSQVANLSSTLLASSDAPGETPSSPLPFSEADRGKLPARIRKFIPRAFPRVLLLRGALEKNLFAGTLDEIRPLLAQASAKRKIPALLVSKDDKRFSLILIVSNNFVCEGAHGVPMKSIFSGAGPSGNVLSQTFCYEP